MKIHTRRMSAWRVACKVASIIVPIAIAGVLLAFLAFAAITSPGCTASTELAAHEAQLQSVIDDPNVTAKTKAQATSRMEQIMAARAEAERQAKDFGEAATAATMLVPGGVAFAGIAGLVARAVAREKALRAVVTAIDRQIETDPDFAAAWHRGKARLRAEMGEKATAIVKRIKAKTGRKAAAKA